jgi:hypothetical protein
VKDVPTIFDHVLPLNLIANTVIFFVAARLYLLPLVSRLRPQQIPNPSIAFNAAPGNDVPNAWRNLSRVAA